MTFSAAFLLLVPIAAQVGSVGDVNDIHAASRPAPADRAAVATVTASARILRPASVRVRRQGNAIEIEASNAHGAQSTRDVAGTLWIEFS